MQTDRTEEFQSMMGEIEWVVPRYSKRILSHHLEGNIAYLAISFLDKSTGLEKISASVFDISVAREYPEGLNPVPAKCPYRILALLSPTREPKAIEWRRRCWASLKQNTSC